MTTNPDRSRRRIRGFTLIEVLIVVLILGILAAIIIPTFSTATDDARRTTFYSSLRTFANAAEVYRVEQGAYLPDGSTGEVPPGFEAYVVESDWTAITPIGGHWDSEFNDNGITAGIGVHFDGGDNPGDAEMALVDAVGDDGVLDSGVFQKLADDRYYWVQAP